MSQTDLVGIRQSNGYDAFPLSLESTAVFDVQVVSLRLHFFLGIRLAVDEICFGAFIAWLRFVGLMPFAKASLVKAQIELSLLPDVDCS
jgi:hypothetical protein